MNIIEHVKSILNECDIVQDFFPNQSIKIDFISQENDEQCGLISTGDSELSKSVTGVGKYRHGFILYARADSINEYEAIANSNFLLELSFYLRNLDLSSSFSCGDKTGEVTKIECANGMKVSFLTESVAGPCEYQLQIFAEYKLIP